jgi:hypothetical protein
MGELPPWQEGENVIVSVEVGDAGAGIDCHIEAPGKVVGITEGENFVFVAVAVKGLVGADGLVFDGSSFDYDRTPYTVSVGDALSEWGRE